MNVRKRAESSTPAMPSTRSRGKPLACMASIARVLPENTAVIEEAVTTTNTVLERSQ